MFSSLQIILKLKRVLVTLLRTKTLSFLLNCLDFSLSNVFWRDNEDESEIRFKKIRN